MQLKNERTTERNITSVHVSQLFCDIINYNNIELVSNNILNKLKIFARETLQDIKTQPF